jgi:hypothetical protein
MRRKSAVVWVKLETVRIVFSIGEIYKTYTSEVVEGNKNMQTDTFGRVFSPSPPFAMIFATHKLNSQSATWKFLVENHETIRHLSTQTPLRTELISIMDNVLENANDENYVKLDQNEEISAPQARTQTKHEEEKEEKLRFQGGNWFRTSWILK